MRPALLSRLRRLRDRAARATAGPLIVRAVLWFLAAAAIASSVPPRVLLDPRFLSFAALVGLLPALWPRTLMVSVMLFTGIGAYVLTGEHAGIARVLLLAALLYLVHTGAALAAVLPYDTVVAPPVVMGWMIRALGVVAATAVVTVLLTVVVPAGGPGTVFAAIAGIGLMCLAVFVLSRAATRSRDGNQAE